MSQRTRRASEAVEIHYDFLDGCRPGSAKSKIEDSLLDVTQDPYDKRYGHGDFLYGKGKSFQDWLKEIANTAQTFTATTDLWREVELTLQMVEEEGIDWLPLQPHHLPADTGFMLFPYGIKVPTHLDYGLFEVKDTLGRATKIYDQGGGTEWWVDGFIWKINDRVSADGFVGPPKPGVTIFPLTRWRDDPGHRPFRLAAMDEGFKAPALVASDITAWAFDEPGSYEWGGLSIESGGGNALPSLGKSKEEQEAFTANLIEHRNWMRMLVWVTFRWLTEETWVPESPDNRQLRRKMQRARPVIHENLMEDGEIVIVDLRLERKEAIAKGEAGGEPPWWRSRWIVKGHWAKRRFAIRDEHGRPVGPTRGEGAVEGETFYYKKVKIEPFIKGPDSAPLVLRDRVGVLSR